MIRIKYTLILGLMLTGTLAHAEKAAPMEVAQQFVTLGQTLFKEGNYASALENFNKAAERLEGLPGGVPPVLYRNIARCHDQLGAVQAGIENYQRFVDKAPDTPALAKATRHAREAIERLQRILDATAVSFSVKPKGASVVFDGKPLAKIPVGNWRVAPGKHSIKVSAPGHQPRTLDITVAVGSTVPLIIQLDSDKPAPQAAVTRDATGSKTLSYALTGVAIASFGGALWAKLESDAIYQSEENQTINPNSRTAESESMGDLGWGLVGLGGAALVGAILAWPSSSGAKTAVLPTLGDGGGGIAWITRF